ncbi:PEPxxWA-CTERM sorting domain-containing protein [Sphingomonas nostoxanthinifaciens]|uniref:PEPxxWA-CTERM sorting domain-containing protein n=1 Tax=Sphingomonas nostoxanthinifaciens TaxID=2872652 RepID=UPI001CC21351|nr:PEPxxWA-CTERM sorting domain-containing protein [Sphingomonas nostoxanthinifaciens]UAK23962.1 PEPxxWA-CTERM sorting domain-containing protein [Sphingomonas nostoxanthinifaciens]
MNAIKPILCAALACVATAASADVFIYDPVLDPATATTVSSITSIILPAATFNLHPGDIVQGTISFLGGAAVTLTSDPASVGGGYEYVSLDIRPSTVGTVSGTGQLSFTGIGGDYTGAPVQTNLSNGLLAASALNDLTPTAFSFTGIAYSMTYTSGTPTIFTPDMLQLGYHVAFGPTTPLAVPEAATWAMMIGGLGLVGATMRRRAGILRPAA